MHLYTDDDLAEMFQLPTRTVIRHRLQLGWPHVKLGRQVRYTEAQIAEIVRLHSHIQTEEGRRTSRGIAAGLSPRSAAYWARNRP